MLKIFGHPFLSRGFRPFFLMGALYAVLSIGFWVLQMQGAEFLALPFEDIVVWHGHEMIFGFTIAIVAGFLLTAVANWTGGAPARQLHLAALCLLWAAGRMVMNLDLGLDFFVIAVIDLAFIPALVMTLLVPLIRSWNKRNFIFLFMLTILFLCNISVFVFQDRRMIYIAILVIMAMISLIGGRIIPAFTVAALRRMGMKVYITDQYHTDAVALLSLLFMGMAVYIFGTDHMITGSAAILSALIHAWRIRFYHIKLVWKDPLLWSLHVGYMWLVAGLALFGTSVFRVISLSPALHALTVGAIGTMTLSMMCRVALGHTGRALIVGKGTVLTFFLMQAAVIIRVFSPILFPDLYSVSILFSGLFWMCAFLIYIVLYTPVLWRPRPDGLPA